LPAVRLSRRIIDGEWKQSGRPALPAVRLSRRIIDGEWKQSAHAP
jgi:hypothetical protein